MRDLGETFATPRLAVTSANPFSGCHHLVPRPRAGRLEGALRRPRRPSEVEVTPWPAELHDSGKGADDGRPIVPAESGVASDPVPRRQPASRARTREGGCPPRRRRRRLSRKRKGSRSREKQRTHRRLANARRNWQHHGSKRLAAKAQAIALEALRTRGMTASARGTTDHPATKVRRKAGLNRAIQHAGRVARKQTLDYEAVEVIEMPAGLHLAILQQLRLHRRRCRRSQASFVYVACSHAPNGDLNAARNMDAGLGNRAVAR